MKNSINAFDVEDFVVIAMALASMTEINKETIEEIKSQKCVSKQDVEDLKTLKHLDKKMKSTLEKVENILGSISE
ncbi:hypothetical protein [Clostridium perfringens]|uniref:hypothetical protein n=1 Tax=Clostridium perfringens TaxID=1502 RepID=UPI001A1C9FFA|nr:hypothetical protein [Clostridium perfringens]HAT4340682.1 hypothetical protein [Clostridium perfringens]HAT4346090.1 hypothetical protein [Clostridium perfringens]